MNEDIVKFKPDEILYNTAMGMLGIVSEQGWPGADRYWNNPFSLIMGIYTQLTILKSPLGKQLLSFMRQGGFIDMEITK